MLLLLLYVFHRTDANAVCLHIKELLRQKGNVAFQSKSFELACMFYSQAIDKHSDNHVRVFIYLLV